MAKISAVEFRQRITQLRNEVVYSALEGNYKKYKTAAKESAKYTLENYNAAKQIPSPKVSVPIFSKYGLNMLKVMILNFFRIKTPEEKALKLLGKQEQLKQDTAKFMKEG